MAAPANRRWRCTDAWRGRRGRTAGRNARHMARRERPLPAGLRPPLPQARRPARAAPAGAGGRCGAAGRGERAISPRSPAPSRRVWPKARQARAHEHRRRDGGHLCRTGLPAAAGARLFRPVAQRGHTCPRWEQTEQGGRNKGPTPPGYAGPTMRTDSAMLQTALTLSGRGQRRGAVLGRRLSGPC